MTLDRLRILPALVLTGGVLLAGPAVPPAGAASLQTDFAHFLRDVGSAASTLPPSRVPSRAKPWVLALSGTALEVPEGGWVDRLYPAGDAPEYLYAPRLRLVRGVGPFGSLTGFWSEDPERDLRVLGAGAGLVVGPSRPGLPRVGFRVLGTRTTGERAYVVRGVRVEALEVETYGGEGLVTLDVGPISPYVGYGVFAVDGSAEARSAPVTLRDVARTEDRVLAGMVIPAEAMHLAVQLDLAPVNLLTVEAALRF